MFSIGLQLREMSIDIPRESTFIEDFDTLSESPFVSLPVYEQPRMASNAFSEPTPEPAVESKPTSVFALWMWSFGSILIVFTVLYVYYMENRHEIETDELAEQQIECFVMELDSNVNVN